MISPLELIGYSSKLFDFTLFIFTGQCTRVCSHYEKVFEIILHRIRIGKSTLKSTLSLSTYHRGAEYRHAPARISR